MSCRLVAGRVRKSHGNARNSIIKWGSASVAVVWCRLMTGDKTLLLISGSQVRVLVRPPNKINHLVESGEERAGKIRHVVFIICRIVSYGRVVRWHSALE